MHGPRPATVLAFGLGSLLVPLIHLAGRLYTGEGWHNLLNP